MASVPDVKAPTGDKEDVLGAHSSFRDHRAESEARTWHAVPLAFSL